MLFDHSEFDGHVRVTHVFDPVTGLRLIHAIHRVRNGLSAGGTRFKSYADSNNALTDALRLSRAMTYKFALADLEIGGAKTVIVGDPSKLKTPALLKRYGEYIQSLNGLYIAGSDVGTTMEDMAIIGEITSHVAGREKGSSEPTAMGVFNGIRAACRAVFGTDVLAGRSVAVQGAGGVGSSLCKLLAKAGASVTVADIDGAAVAAVAKDTGARIVPVSEILEIEADVLAPCALGAILSKESIPKLRVPAVCGSANNQLATPADGDLLQQRGIAFVPDYVASAGGVMVGATEVGMIDEAGYRRRLAGIYDRALAILEQARERKVRTDIVAAELAQQVLSK
jgi:leucine dehydrogenase